MSDAQSFYLLLAGFYLYECLEFAPNGAWAFVGRGGSKWRWRNPAFHLSGAHKDVFCAPLIPWPGLLTVFPKPATAPPSPRELRHLRKKSRNLGKATQGLRLCSLFVFLHYFALLPVAYHFFIGTPWMIAVIVQGELLAFITAFHFHRWHKRFFPEEKWERRLETLYNAFLPWHSMRASDLIVKKQSAHWHPLACLVSHPHATPNLKKLSRLWRQARFDRNEDQLLPALEYAGIDPTPWDLPPNLDHDRQKFCPLCRTIYEAEAQICVDCKDVPLISPSD